MDLKSCNMTVGMSQSTGPKRKDARGKEEMSQSTLKDSKWERESKERERVSGYRGSFWLGVACRLRIKWWTTTLTTTLIWKGPEQCKS